MQKTFIALLFSVSVCFSNLSAVDIQDNTYYEIEKSKLQKLFKEKDLDFDSKSLVGWVRVLNSPDKRVEYRLNDLNDNQIVYLTSKLKELSKVNTAFEGKLR